MARTLVAPLLAATLTACADGRATATPAPPTAGLLVLAGEPGAATLTVHDEAGGPRSVGLPAPATAWISAGPGRRLAATLDDGTLYVGTAPAAAGGDAGWRDATDDRTELPNEPLRFAAWSPTGTHIAALAADFGASSGLTVAVIDPVARAALLLPIPGDPVVAPLAWLADDRVLVQTDGGSLVVDIVTGGIAEGPRDAPIGAPIATVPRSLVALADPAGGAVEVRPLDRWLAGDRGDPLARVEAEAGVGSIALTASGDRLAVVWQQVQRPGMLAIYSRAEGWREVTRSTLPGESARAAVDWLR